MKTVEQVMRQDIPTIGTGRTVAEAIAVVFDREVSALPVVEDGRLIGLITLRDLLRGLPYRPVTEIMPRETVTATRDMLIASAYTLMEERRVSQLPVVEGDLLVGMVTLEDVLRELGRPLDPLTELPWSTALREHAEQLLSSGHEIALIFLDLDNFGLVNKQLGHAQGDQVIKAVAKALGAIVDVQKDLLCRYGGDEFAILTTRPRDEAEALALRAMETIARVAVPDGHAELTLAASVGIAGGKRTSERDVHTAATIDDLITMASLQSTQAKIEKARQLPYLADVRPALQPRVRLQRFDLSIEGSEATAAVELSLRGRRITGEVRGPGFGTVPLRLLAEATVRAVNQLLNDGWVAAVDEVRIVQTHPDTLLVVTILLGSPDAPAERYTGASIAGSDLGSAAVKATLQALNRRLGQIVK
ncbi:MAG: diguanylate cyclase [Armatimonadota bacterium]|nr:diguanylate cyclase [Armatimonadota bacterium]